LQRAAWKRTQNLFFVEDTRYWRLVTDIINT
jgi:hypothetical protein